MPSETANIVFVALGASPFVGLVCWAIHFCCCRVPEENRHLIRERHMGDMELRTVCMPSQVGPVLSLEHRSLLTTFTAELERRLWVRVLFLDRSDALKLATPPPGFAHWPLLRGSHVLDGATGVRWR